jgi:hypothetical protein
LVGTDKRKVLYYTIVLITLYEVLLYDQLTVVIVMYIGHLAITGYTTSLYKPYRDQLSFSHAEIKRYLTTCVLYLIVIVFTRLFIFVFLDYLSPGIVAIKILYFSLNAMYLGVNTAKILSSGE